MRMLKINLRPYKRSSIPKLILSYQAIIDAVRDNPDFPDPVPAVPEMQTTLNNFSEEAAAVAAKNFTRKPERNLLRTVIESQLNTLSVYCVYAALRNSASKEEAFTKVHGVNFKTSKAGGKSVAKPLPATGYVCSKSLSQAVEFKWNSQKKSEGYILMSTIGMPSDDSVWTETYSPRANHTFTNIPPGQIISCKVYAINGAGWGQPSNIISAVAGM